MSPDATATPPTTTGCPTMPGARRGGRVRRDAAAEDRHAVLADARRVARESVGDDRDRAAVARHAGDAAADHRKARMRVGRRDDHVVALQLRERRDDREVVAGRAQAGHRDPTNVARFGSTGLTMIVERAAAVHRVDQMLGRDAGEAAPAARRSGRAKLRRICSSGGSSIMLRTPDLMLERTSAPGRARFEDARGTLRASPSPTRPNGSQDGRRRSASHSSSITSARGTAGGGNASSHARVSS